MSRFSLLESDIVKLISKKVESFKSKEDDINKLLKLFKSYIINKDPVNRNYKFVLHKIFDKLFIISNKFSEKGHYEIDIRDFDDSEKLGQLEDEFFYIIEGDTFGKEICILASYIIMFLNIYFRFLQPATKINTPLLYVNKEFYSLLKKDTTKFTSQNLLENYKRKATKRYRVIKNYTDIFILLIAYIKFFLRLNITDPEDIEAFNTTIYNFFVNYKFNELQESFNFNNKEKVFVELEKLEKQQVSIVGIHNRLLKIKKVKT